MSFVALSDHGRRHLLTLEGAASALPPARSRALSIVTPECAGDSKKGTVEQRTIIADKLDETSLDDQAAQLDEMACARAPFHDPIPHIISRSLSLKSVQGCLRAAQRAP